MKNIVAIIAEKLAISPIMAKRTPYRDEILGFIDDYAPIMEDFTIRIQEGLKKGVPVGVLITAIVFELSIVDNLRTKVLKHVDKSFAIGANIKTTQPGTTKAIAFRKSWLNQTWPNDKFSLSARTTHYGAMEKLKASIKQSMKLKKTWLEMASSLNDTNLIKGDIAEHIIRLNSSARRAMNGNPAEIRKYEKLVKQSERKIARLAKNNAPNRRLKAAYANVISATEAFSIKAMDKAISKAVLQKAQYNAERIARTEIARAYGQGFYADCIADPDVIGLRWHLSKRHHITDVCDFHAEADLYGMGEGTYSLASVPPYPAHPNCLCPMSKVFKDEVEPARAKDFNPDKAKDYLNKQSEARRKKMLTIDGNTNFKRDNNVWDKELRQWQGNKSVKRMLITK